MYIENDAQLVGKTILVGINYFDEEKCLTKQEQFYGIISSQSGHVLEITLNNGNIRHIPFDGILYAPKGQYKCLSSGELVKNPDYLVSWLVEPHVEVKGALSATLNYAPLFSYSVPQEWELTYEPDLDWLQNLIKTKGKDYIGKQVVIGLSYYKSPGNEQDFIEQKQVHGHIKRVSKGGITLLLSDGSEFSLPPDLTLLQPAGPGNYLLKSTNETITNVDFVTAWNSTSP